MENANVASKLSPAQIYGDAGLTTSDTTHRSNRSPMVRRRSAALDRRSVRSPNRLTTHRNLATTTR
ncbi:MAG: hypothetical protein ACKPKO_15885 [Candidatus Fonsibacter sp.]